jgi:hypothetical protein
VTVTGYVVVAVTGCVACGLAVARGCPGVVGGAAAVVAGTVLGATAALRALGAATAVPPRLSVAANTPAVAMAARARSAIIAVITPARKLISSSRALTAA